MGLIKDRQYHSITSFSVDKLSRYISFGLAKFADEETRREIDAQPISIQQYHFSLKPTWKMKKMEDGTKKMARDKEGNFIIESDPFEEHFGSNKLKKQNIIKLLYDLLKEKDSSFEGVGES